MSAESEAAGAPSLRRLVGYSLVAGLANLIPLPILDDWVRDVLRQRQAMEIARRFGVALTGAEGKVLGSGHHPASAQGCLLGCLRTLVVKPVEFLFKIVFRKIVRKVLFFLTVKDVIDTFSLTLHEGYLLRHALELGALTSPPAPQGAHGSPPPPGAQPAAAEAPTGPPRPRVLALRKAIEATCEEVDPRPIEKAARAGLRGSRRVLRRAGRSMSRRLRGLGRRPDEQTVYERLERHGEEELGSLIDELTAAIASQTSYLEDLGRRLEARLAEPEPSAPRPGG